MKGEELCNSLRDQLLCETDTELAKKLGITSARVSQLKKQRDVTPKYVARLVKKVEQNGIGMAFKSAIRPVVEFFPIEVCCTKENSKPLPFDVSTKHGLDLRKRLEASHGVYAFYNSQAEIIYFGKADKMSLFDEMKNAYSRTFPSYKVYNVKHPFGRYKAAKGEELRRIMKMAVSLVDTAAYFSAYDVAPDLIASLEALFIRIAPNDLINVRIEKKDMKAFPDPAI